MDRTERFYRIDQLLRERRCVPLALFIEALGVSRATIKRDLEYLRDRFNAPIVWDRALNGYRYEEPLAGGPRFSLPGLWFNAAEIHALMTMDHLLAGIEPGLLRPHLEPLRTRIRRLLESGEHSAEEVGRRIRVVHLGARAVEPAHFQVISTALLERRRLRMGHYNRGTGEVTERVVSPQRLVYYRDNWYLDAWCHLRKALRSFAVDVIREAFMLADRARDLPAATLDAELGRGYGIFAGRPVDIARLRFTAARSRWVGREQWHPDQSGVFDEQGRYILEVPYSDDRELLMDIMRHGPEVEVLAPDTLRDRIAAMLAEALACYQSATQSHGSATNSG
jgi:predicted DNA-binding transcriptional regulator YafY